MECEHCNGSCCVEILWCGLLMGFKGWADSTLCDALRHLGAISLDDTHNQVKAKSQLPYDSRRKNRSVPSKR